MFLQDINLQNQKGASYWAILIVVAFMAAAIIVAFWPQIDVPEDNFGAAHVRLYNKLKKMTISLSERAKIEKWIVDNKLNEYGDPADTLYAGGSPLFNEATGERVDKYEYIKKKHPDEPWNK